MLRTRRRCGPASLLLETTLLLLAVTSSQAGYRVGVGIADMTGPVAEVGMMGYANPSQKTSGIHLRQFSRAFVLDDGASRLVFVSADCGMISSALKRQVLKELAAEYGRTYTDSNLMLSGTHTHSAPGGFLHYFLYDISVLGFVQHTFNAYVKGIVKSIRRAHENVAEAKVWVNTGDVEGVNVNRSPAAYSNNPAHEKESYLTDVDKTMVQLRFEGLTGQPLGALQWFAVHPTSMNVTNHLISSDNVGAASLFFEMKMNPDLLPGKGRFVGAFASTNLGDVSPNVLGPRCERSGVECDEAVGCSKGERCFAVGPGRDMFHSVRIVAETLVGKALELFQDKNGAHEVKGPLKVIHQHIDMPNTTISVYDEETRSYKTVTGCVAAMGYSFAAGTRDGTGSAAFKQGTKSTNPMFNFVRNLLAEPTPSDEQCHGAKPILIATGQMNYPYPWQPRIVPTHLAVIGDVAVACVPGEFTTMSGRRLREAIKDALPGVIHVVVAGLCNEYTSYITTPEEYEIQRYEGASTIFGPHTLSIYLHQYSRLAEALANDSQLDDGPQPEDFTSKLVSFVTPVLFDNHPFRRRYGSVLKQPHNVTKPGEVVHVSFVSGHPRNNPRQGDTFLTVEMQLADGSWKVIATDASWETKFQWMRTNRALGYSEAHISWEVPGDAVPGQYRIRHFGDYKYIFGGVFPYEGSSNPFQVVRDST